MRKFVSTVIAVMLMCAMLASSLTAFADNVITAEEVTINGDEENISVQMKDSITEEEGMLQISPATLLTIKLKLEADSPADKSMLFIANKATEANGEISTESVQFIDEPTTAADGAVTIQFRPRTTDAVGIYNMRAASEGAVFSKFYKTIGDKKQPVLTSENTAQQGRDITVTVSDYTVDWKNSNRLYEILGESKTEITNYTVTPGANTPNIAKLIIPTEKDIALGEHSFRFEPITAGSAYNPITFKVTITEPEKEYTIAFDENGVEAKSFTLSTIPLGGIVLPEPEKNGYLFDGWYREATYETKLDSPVTADNVEAIFGLEAAVTLYAKWKPVAYTIVYHNTEGAENTNPQSYTIESETIALSALERTGYDFGGWYGEESLETAVTEITKGSLGNKALYAKWIPKTYTVTYNKNGGTIENENNFTSYTYGTGLTLPNPEREGWYFRGWYDNAEFSGEPALVIASDAAENKTFWAKWDESEPTEYMIVFLDDNGTRLKKGMVNVGEIPECEEPVKEQDDKYTYSFKAWEPSITAVTSNATYTATYDKTPRVYTVTYEKDGGVITDEGNYTSYTYGTALTLPIPEKDGYDFDGWYSDNAFTEKVTAISNNATGNKTVYAKWRSTVDYKLLRVDKEKGSVKLIKQTNGEAWLIVATYKDGHLVKAKLKNISELVTGADGEDVSVADVFSVDCTGVKVFMWNNIDDMIPRCPSIGE